MGTTKHRKNHKKKLAAFKQDRKARLNTIMNLSGQLEQAMSALNQPAPTYPVVQNTSKPLLTLTGQEENNEEKYELNQMAL